MATYRGAGQLIRQFSTSAVREKLAEMPIKLYGVEGRYASALFSAATKEKKLDVVSKELAAFQGLMKSDPKLADFLVDPSYQRQKKRAAMTKVIESLNYSSLTANFFDALSENGRLPKTKSVLAAFESLVNAQKGAITCIVTTAKPLDSTEEKNLRAALQGFAKDGKSLSIEMKIDPAIMGGMLVNIGDKFIDMSTASKMKKYTTLIQAAV